jgi:hypothetical protein
MITLKKLNLADTEELHRRLGRRWRNSRTHATACRRYRLMCKVFIHEATLLRLDRGVSFALAAA